MGQPRETPQSIYNRQEEVSHLPQKDNMKAAIITLSLLLVASCQVSSAVTVTEGEYTFSLESVKELGALMKSKAVKQNLARDVRANPALPKDFIPICQNKDAGLSLTRLAFVAVNADSCEICEFVACTGC